LRESSSSSTSSIPRINHCLIISTSLDVDEIGEGDLLRRVFGVFAASTLGTNIYFVSHRSGEREEVALLEFDVASGIIPLRKAEIAFVCVFLLI